MDRTVSGRILIAGVARSGTTWVGRVLEKAPGVVYVNEPDNREAHWFADVGRQGLGFLPVLRPGAPARHYGLTWDVAFRGGWPQNPRLDRMARGALRMPRPLRAPALSALGRRVARIPAAAPVVVCKSVYVPLALEWVAAHTQARPLIVRRHPLNILASWIELGVPAYPIDQDPRVRELVLEPLGLPAPPEPASHVQLVAWCIGVLDAALLDARSQHRDWIVVSHEELCLDPVGRFRRLFAELHLRWTDAVEQYLSIANRQGEGYVTERISTELPDAWRRRLTAVQIAEAEEVLAGFAPQALATDLRATR